MSSSLTIRGISASPGHARGHLAVLTNQAADVIESLGTAAEESERLSGAIASAIADLSTILEQTDDADAVGMLEFQIAMLEDDSLSDTARQSMSTGQSAAASWKAVLDAEIDGYESAGDEYFRARAVDLQDLRDRVLRHLRGTRECAIPADAIIVADELTPSRFLEHCHNISGIALHQGSSSSHVAILARAQGIPMLIQLPSASLKPGDTALLDAVVGELTVNPDREQHVRFEHLQAQAEQERAADRVHLWDEATLANGERVQVLVNIANPDEVDDLDTTTVDGVGLVRTEFLFEGHHALPDEEQQFRVYRRLLEWGSGRPVTIRTLDAGADKPIVTLTPLNELNPFLGVRGLRLSLRRPDVFKTQLRALLRAGNYGPLKIMLPMVTEPVELEQARELMRVAQTELTSEGIAVEAPVVGIMVEVPACALCIERFDAEFYSIGSNDLLQYLTACGRDCGALEHLVRPDNPALLELIKRVVEHGKQAGKSVSLCGDMGADRRYLGTLLDLGLRTVSVAPPAVAHTKALIAAHGARHSD